MSSDDKDISNKVGRNIIREMEIDDIPAVYHLGEQLFTSDDFPTLYRTWDSFEVTYYYNSDSDYCLVAEETGGKVIGFALGSIVEKSGSPWKYGYLAWLGVAHSHQGTGVAARLLKEFEKRIEGDGARILLVDTEAGNHKALHFFHHNGFAHPKTHVWLSKSLAKDKRDEGKPSGEMPHRSHRSKKEGVWLKSVDLPKPRAIAKPTT